MIINDLFIRVHRFSTSSVHFYSRTYSCYTYSYLTALLYFSGRFDVRFIVQKKVHAGFMAARYQRNLQLQHPQSSQRSNGGAFATHASKVTCDIPSPEQIGPLLFRYTRFVFLVLFSWLSCRGQFYVTCLVVVSFTVSRYLSCGDQFHVTYLLAISFTLPVLWWSVSRYLSCGHWFHVTYFVVTSFTSPILWWSVSCYLSCGN